MDSAVFSELADIVLKTSGQVLHSGQVALVNSRLTSLLRREGFAGVEELLACIRARRHEALAREMVEALTSRETWFFRERESLEHLVGSHLLGRVRDEAEGKRLRVWCAGVSSGQEVYSLAMLLDENPAFEGVRVDLLATDISAACMARVRSGIYGHFEIQRGLSVQRMLKYFKPAPDGQWQASRALRERVSIREHNLLDDMGGLGMFDAILCRNVLPGMARGLQGGVLQRLAGQLKPGGALLLAGGENPVAAHGIFTPNRDCTGFFMTEQDAETAAA